MLFGVFLRCYDVVVLCCFCLVFVFVLYLFRVCLYVCVVFCLGLFWFRVWLVVVFVVVLFVGAAFVLWFGLACVCFCVCDVPVVV